MSFEIEYSKKAQKQIKKVDKQSKKRIISVIERSRIRPENHFERLVGEKVYKLRVGDYRIIADINGADLLILVIEVGYRRNVYK